MVIWLLCCLMRLFLDADHNLKSSESLKCNHFKIIKYHLGK
uniref:Uncharacterized protein n=1 Tax=Anguilla anguilla TaxID=7936 RepID=A0A0E9RDW7_ANGAN